MSADGMMEFRTTYLQAIAWAWQSPDNYKKMTSVVGTGLEFLKSFGLAPLWNIQITFAADVSPGNGYHPNFAGRWVGPRPRLQFPVPVKVPAADQTAAAAAAYYQALPTPFGPNTSGGGGGPGGEGMGPVSDALVLGATMMRAVAMYWNPPGHGVPPDPGTAAYRSELLEGTSSNLALQKWLGYNCPWNMDLHAVASPAAWTPHKPTHVPGTGSWDMKLQAALTLWVPHAPAENSLNCQGFALAAYNETGAAYPLTCP